MSAGGAASVSEASVGWADGAGEGGAHLGLLGVEGGVQVRRAFEPEQLALGHGQRVRRPGRIGCGAAGGRLVHPGGPGDLVGQPEPECLVRADHGPVREQLPGPAGARPA